jgi:hypothetical protein
MSARYDALRKHRPAPAGSMSFAPVARVLAPTNTPRS